MNAILNLAMKDLRILSRDKLAAFFILGFPILMGVFFGLVMNGSQSGSNAMRILIVDQDKTEGSKQLIQLLTDNKNLIVEESELAVANDAVRKGKRVGYIEIPVGFGTAAGVVWQEQPEIVLATDPSRGAEGAMLEGFLMQAMGQITMEGFNDTDRMLSNIKQSQENLQSDESLGALQKMALNKVFNDLSGTMTALNAFDSLMGQISKPATENDSQTPAIPTTDPLKVREETADTAAAGQGNFQLANIKRKGIDLQLDPNSPRAISKKLTSNWDLSFPQGMLWGVLGCGAGFAISVAKERSQGTMVRLQASPLSTMEILLGKALACFMAVIAVILMMTVLGFALGMRPGNFLFLGISAFCVAICFVGIMMTMSVLGKTEQSVSGSGWAINMIMAMFGGAMVPLFFFPPFLQTLSTFSPVKWAIYSLEGAIWRGLAFQELLVPWLVLIGIGISGFLIGTTLLRRSLGS